jgi:potassium inwardly-rectifying channel subfamily J
MFRVGDMRKSHIIGANVRAQLIKTKTTREGEVLYQYQTELEIGTDSCANDLFLIWPLIIYHKINEDSPLYNTSASDMIQERFEIVVFLEGTVESTGQTTQARSSYLSSGESLEFYFIDLKLIYIFFRNPLGPSL